MDAEELERQLAGAVETINLLQESLADVEASFAREDRGWSLPGQGVGQFTPLFRRHAAARAVVASVADPLIKRALSLRCAYIWAGGVQVTVRDDPSQGQDVNAVLRSFWEDEDVQETFSSVQALIKLERQNGTHGEVFLALPTDPRTGRVRVRSLPPAEFGDIIYDPEDAARPWFYPRTYTPKGGTSQTVLHPALSYRPATRERVHGTERHPIRWDAPVLHVAVNMVGDRGVGDLFAALPWARGYVNFLTDWAKYMHALSKIAFLLSTRGDRTQQAAAQVASLTPGSALAVTSGDRLEAVSKGGASIDADSGRPLAVMVAAAVDLPVTTLLGDPGLTGARATAEDVSDESWAPFQVRQDLWAMVLRRVADWVIDSAVIAPLGPLRGTIVRDGDRQYAVLPDGDVRSVVVAFPEHDSADAESRVKAIAAAAQTETVPPLVTLRLLLQALDVPDLDDVLKLVTDDRGDFIPLDVMEQRVRGRLADRGGM